MVLLEDEGDMAGKKTAALLKVAAKQDGVVTIHDGRSVGMSYAEFRHARTTLGWRELQPKTYATFAQAPTWRQRLRAAHLAAGPQAVIAGETAAALMKWDGCREGPIVLVVPKNFTREVRGATVHQSRNLRAEHTWRVDGFKITRPARTLVDLALTKTDAELEMYLNCLARRGDNDELLRLRGELKTFKQQRSKRVLNLLGDILWKPAVPESVLETKLVQALRANGFSPTVQYELRDGGRIIKRFDAAFPDKCVAVEADSNQHHGTPNQRMRDIQQRNEARALGWQVIEVTAEGIRQPEAMVRSLRFALNRAPSKPLVQGPMPTTQASLFEARPKRVRFLEDSFLGPAPEFFDTDP